MSMRSLACALLAPAALLAQLQLFLVEGQVERPVVGALDLGAIDAGDALEAVFRIRNPDPLPVRLETLSAAGTGFALARAAAPVFQAIMEKVLPYLNVLPKGTLIVKKEPDSIPHQETPGAETLTEEVKMGKGMERVVMPDLTGLSMRNALSRIEGKGLIIKVSGNGKVVEQAPKAGAVVEKGDICYLKFQSPS